ncbi:hypothetical protein WJX84_004966 [Apatococcus fuscideae]|uniref:Transposase n=1 Tax=Apatococcus fuscideae TaxID=2026836 RepID=A0AAW1TFZ2_9CHLO
MLCTTETGAQVSSCWTFKFLSRSLKWEPFSRRRRTQGSAADRAAIVKPRGQAVLTRILPARDQNHLELKYSTCRARQTEVDGGGTTEDTITRLWRRFKPSSAFVKPNPGAVHIEDPKGLAGCPPICVGG